MRFHLTPVIMKILMERKGRASRVRAAPSRERSVIMLKKIFIFAKIFIFTMR